MNRRVGFYTAPCRKMISEGDAIVNIMYKIMGKLLGWENQDEEYFNKFIVPLIEYGRELGLSDDELKDIFHQSLEESDFILLHPARLMKDKIDEKNKNHNTLRG